MISPTNRSAFKSSKIFPVLALALAVSQAYGNQIDTNNFWYRDFLDLAQNKGQFKPGATGITIEKKDGTQFQLPNVPIPNFSAISSKGPTTSIGGAYVVTAWHVEDDGAHHHAIKDQRWGNTVYHWKDQRHIGDFSVDRLDKFVVETTGFNGIDDKLSFNQLIDRYGVEVNGKKELIGFRVGSGLGSIVKDGKTINLGAAFNESLLSASLFRVPQDGRADALFSEFKNQVTSGDSGSSFLVYDSQKKEWVILGTLGGLVGGTNQIYFNKWNQGKVDELKQAHTQAVALDGKSAKINDKTSITLNGSNTAIGEGKDLSFTGGGTIDVAGNMHLGIGGLIFDGGHEYTVKGDNASFKGAGVDIGKGTTVHWNIKGDASDNLHKIGEGTLEVNVAQGNKLKIGNGTVDLKAEKSFENIYMASGNGTVKLNHDKALSGGEFGGIFFGNSGGTLDLNGHNFDVKRIAANDDGAVIANSNDKKSTVTLANSGKYMYHGRFEKNLDINIKNDQKPTDAPLILDGGADIKGNITVSNASVTMQGHATDHAVFGKTVCPGWLPCMKAEDVIINAERPDADKYGKDYMINNQVSSFNQPDWDNRTFKFNTLKLENADLNVGRNATVIGNIDANNAKVVLGSATVYRDEHSGKNLTGEGFGFQQNVISGTSSAPSTVRYVGDITAKNSTFEANNFLNEASFNLDNSTYRSTYAFNVTRLRDDGIHLKNKSNLNLNAVYVQDAKKDVIIVADDTSSMSMGSLSVNNSTVDIQSHLDVRGRIEAENKATVKLKDWTYKDSNLWSDASSSFTIGKLTAKAGSNIQAGLTINDELKVASLDNGNKAFGIRADRLTLNTNAVVKADFSSEALSVNNFAFDQKYTLVSANTLTDNRTNQKVQYSQGNGYRFEDVKGDNSLDFIIHRGEATKGYTSFYRVPDTPMPDVEARAQAVMAAYAKRYGTDDAKKLAENVVAHNQNSGDNKYQEVALYDALNNKDINAGVEALHNIKTRTDDTYQALGRQIDTQKLFAPVRSAVMNRLASLSMGQGQRDEGASRFFIDAGAGFFNGDDDLRYVHTGFGTDAQIVTGDNSLIVGGMLGIGRANDKFGASNEIKADMYTMTGYLGWQNASGWELQNFLTGAYLNGDRTINTEINLGGAQTFDEEGWAVMNATYLKYRIPLSEGQYNVSLKPMLLADLTWSHVGETNTAFFKRDGASEFTGYAGAGLELEASSDKQSYFFQLTGRHRLTGDTNTVGVNLNGSNGYTNIDVNAGASFIADMNVTAKLKLTPTSDIDLSVGASADSEGGKGAHGQARVNWYF